MGASKLGQEVVVVRGWYCTCGGKKKVEKDGSKDQRGRTESCADGAVIMTIQVSCQSVRPE